MKRWKIADLSVNEKARLADLDSYKILDTPPEGAFDRLTSMALRHFNVPISLVSLIDEKRQWFKSKQGLDAPETSRDLAFCAHVILDDEVMVVPDATMDDRFADNPLVAGDPDIRFYAGAPIKSKAGHNLGTLCIIDRVARTDFSDAQKKELSDLAAIVADEMELRRAIRGMDETKDLALRMGAKAEAAASDTKVIDFSRVALIATAPEEVDEVFSLFLRLADKAVAAMEEAQKNGDIEHWFDAAHSLKGSSANLGMPIIAQLCTQALKTINIPSDDSAELLVQIKQALIDVRTEIDGRDTTQQSGKV